MKKKKKLIGKTNMKFHLKNWYECTLLCTVYLSFLLILFLYLLNINELEMTKRKKIVKIISLWVIRKAVLENGTFAKIACHRNTANFQHFFLLCKYFDKTRTTRWCNQNLAYLLIFKVIAIEVHVHFHQ